MTKVSHWMISALLVLVGVLCSSSWQLTRGYELGNYDGSPNEFDEVGGRKGGHGPITEWAVKVLQREEPSDGLTIELGHEKVSGTVPDWCMSRSG
jgi:hypothetical protein